MRTSGKLGWLAGCLLVSMLTGPSIQAATVTGTLMADDGQYRYDWTLSSMSNVTISTDSYASGGFVPVLSLFDASTGEFLAVNGGDASCSNGRMADGATGICNDAYLSTTLDKGDYAVIITQFYNYPNGSNLSDGFSEDGMGNFTAGVCSATSGSFYETDLAPCVQRTGNFSLNVSAVATPEPASGLLALPVLAIAAFRFRKGRAKLSN